MCGFREGTWVSRGHWKQKEREAAAIIGGKRYPANQRGPADCESSGMSAQVKERRTLSLAQIEALAWNHAGRRHTAEGRRADGEALRWPGRGDAMVARHHGGHVSIPQRPAADGASAGLHPGRVTLVKRPATGRRARSGVANAKGVCQYSSDVLRGVSALDPAAPPEAEDVLEFVPVAVVASGADARGRRSRSVSWPGCARSPRRCGWRPIE